jgi:hypothetical protein
VRKNKTVWLEPGVVDNSQNKENLLKDISHFEEGKLKHTIQLSNEETGAFLAQN